MSTVIRVVPKILLQELDLNDDWEIVRGSRHFHIRIRGRLAGILPARAKENDRRVTLNLISQVRAIRRAVTA